MPRRKRVVKRVAKPDPKYNSIVLNKVISCVMLQGRKSTAEKIVYGAFDLLEKQGKEPMATFKAALDNIKPLLELKTRRIGGANYQIPIEVTPERAVSLSIRWLINATRDRKEKKMTERLANEILAAIANQGGAVAKKDTTHKMAEANKAFAHYRW